MSACQKVSGWILLMVATRHRKLLALVHSELDPCEYIQKLNVVTEARSASSSDILSYFKFSPTLTHGHHILCCPPSFCVSANRGRHRHLLNRWR